MKCFWIFFFLLAIPREKGKGKYIDLYNTKENTYESFFSIALCLSMKGSRYWERTLSVVFGLKWWMCCSPNLKVVELWSLPELDLVRLVFSCYFVLVLLLLVQAKGFPGSGLWEWRMSVGLQWSCALLLDL